MQVLDILTKADYGFREHLDDTLVNRLCSAVACRSVQHKNIFQSDNWEQQLNKFFTTLPIDRLQADENGLKVLKLGFVVLLTCGNSAPPDLFGIHRLLESYLSTAHFSWFATAILEATDCYLKKCRTVSDLAIVDRIFDESITQLFHNSILYTSNVHQRRLLVELLAQLCVYNSSASPSTNSNRIVTLLTDQLTQLTEFSISFLLRLYKVSSTYGVCIFPISLAGAFPISKEKLVNCSLPYLANLLFLSCIDALSFTDVDFDIFALFSHFTPFPILCAQTICVQLRSGMCVSGILWERVVTSWSNAILDNFTTDSCMSKLVHPVVRAAAGSGKHPNCVKVKFDVADRIWTEVFSLEKPHSVSRNARLLLLRLFKVLVYSELEVTQLNRWLEELWVHTAQLSTDALSEELLMELDAILCLGGEICYILLTQGHDQSVLRYLHKMHEFTMKHRNDILFFPCAHTLVQSIRETKPFINHGELASILFSLLATILYSVEKQEPSSTNEDLSSWDQDSLAVSCSRILSELTISFDWSTSLQTNFVQLMTGLVNQDSGSASKSSLHPDSRIALLCTFLDFLTYIISSPNQNDAPTLDWFLNVGSQLLNFNPSESVEWESSAQLAMQLSYDRLLEGVRSSNGIEPFGSVISFIEEHLSTKLGSLSSTGTSGKVACSDCGESITDLLEDILIAHTSSMSVDCIEG